MVNKRVGCFDVTDERTFAAFSIFCGLGIQAVKLFETTKRSEMRAKVAIEVMSYHARASELECERLSTLKVPSCSALQLDDLRLNTYALDEDGSVLACVRMFIDSGLG
jgi:hypothetical protein